jgi:hypothetical protein
VSRIILSRELSLEEIAEIRQQVPAMELEVFVHGLFSNWLPCQKVLNQKTNGVESPGLWPTLLHWC